MAKGGERSSGTQRVVQSNQLPGFMEGPLKLAAQDAQSVYKSGVGASPFPGSTYVPPTADEMSGMGRLRGLLSSPNIITSQALPGMQDIIANRGLDGNARAFLSPASDIAHGRNRITVGDFEAGGGEQFNRALDIASDRTADFVNSRMGSIGRLGSGAHTGVMTQEIADLQTGARADQLNKDRMLQLQAQGANIANQGHTSLGLADQISSGRDAAMRAAAMSPMLRLSQLGDARGLIDVGGAQRTELQDELQSNIDRFRDTQMEPWQRIGLLTGTLQGFPDMATRTSTSTGTVPRGSPIAGLLGGAAMGAGAGAKMGSFGGIPGAALGGLLGGGLGLFM